MKHKLLLLLLLLFLGFVIIQLPLYKPLLSDENQYFYLAKLVSEGQTPYEDFFFAHTPFQLYILQYIYKLVGYNFFILKSVALIATLMTATLIYKICSYEQSEGAGLIAMLLFLFTYTIFFVGTVNMGVNITAMFCVAAYYFHLKGKYFWSGVLYGLALFSGLYAAPFVIIGLLCCRGHILRKIGGFLLIFGGGSIVFFLNGSGYMNQVFLYHFLKSSGTVTSKLTTFITAFKLDFFIIFSFIIMVIILLSLKRLKMDMLFLKILLFFCFVALLNNPMHYYFVLVYPFMAIFIGIKLLELKKERPRIAISVLLSITLMLVIHGFYMPGYTEQQLKWYEFDGLKEITPFFARNRGVLMGDFSVVNLVALETGNTVLVGPEFDTYPSAAKSIGVNNMYDAIRENPPDYFIAHEMSGTFNPLWKLLEVGEICSEFLFKIEENSNSYHVYSCR